MSSIHPQAIRDLIKPDDPASWDDVWKTNLTPWDVGHIQPPLRNVIQSSQIPFPRGETRRALVPGCGSGVDAIYIASTLGLQTLGIDSAKTAVDRANKNTTETTGLTNLSFSVGDFFKFEPEKQGRFDLVYDYTFFVALPPALRPAWGTQMRNLIKPGGYLITLLYPVHPESQPLPNPLTGPPYLVRVQDYLDVLCEGGKEGEAFVKVLDWSVEVLDGMKDELVQRGEGDVKDVEKHKGKDRLLVWKRV